MIKVYQSMRWVFPRSGTLHIKRAPRNYWLERIPRDCSCIHCSLFTLLQYSSEREESDPKASFTGAVPVWFIYSRISRLTRDAFLRTYVTKLLSRHFSILFLHDIDICMTKNDGPIRSPICTKSRHARKTVGKSGTPCIPFPGNEGKMKRI